MTQSLSALPIDRLTRHPDLVLAFLIACVVAVLIVPVPPVVLDVLLAANVTLSALILAAVLLSERSLAVSSFPSLLLLTTLFRLTLNVSTTRLILSKGDAGEVVRAFGHFVLQGDLVVGMVIFAIITLVQFLVIAKGAERVAEVGARFTLDAMPGKQMAIDAAVRSGASTEEQAQEKREELGRESQFYGAMDGAMKFVKGDAIAGLIITAINLLAGMVIGVVRLDLSAARAAETYCVLSVGDALVSQIPALLITLAAGMLTTRVGSSSKDKHANLGASLRAELLTNGKVMLVAATFAGLLALVPGLPVLPFGVLACALGAAGAHRLREVSKRLRSSATVPTARAEALKSRMEERAKEAKAQRAMSDHLAPAVVMVGVDIGEALSAALGLTPGAEADSEIFQQLPAVRDALYMETGVRFPGVRVRSNVTDVPAGAIVVRIKDVPVVLETIDCARWLASESAERLSRLGVDATPAAHPIGTAKGALVSAAVATQLAETGVRVWSPGGILLLHLTQAMRRNVKLFVGLQEVAELVHRLEKVYPDLVREVMPKIISLAQLTDILRRLVDEGVSIRDLKSIFEALADQGPHHTDNVVLTEIVRSALSLQIGHAYAGLSNRLPVVLLDEVMEDTIRGAIQQTQGGSYLALDLEVRRTMLGSIARTVTPVLAQGVRPIILTSADIRRYVRKLIEEALPSTAVLSFQELPGQLTIQPLGRVVLRDDVSLAA